MKQESTSFWKSNKDSRREDTAKAKMLWGKTFFEKRKFKAYLGNSQWSNLAFVYIICSPNICGASLCTRHCCEVWDAVVNKVGRMLFSWSYLPSGGKMVDYKGNTTGVISGSYKCNEEIKCTM